MSRKKQRRVLFLLEVVEFLLSVIAIIVFTLIFRLETGMIRYLFLLGDCYVIYSFSKTLPSLETKIEKRVIKNSNRKINAEYEKKLSV